MSAANKKVLIVDDDQVLRELLAKLLAGNGYVADLAGDGQEALRKVEEKLYDYIITDINMPVMDGLTFLKNLRQKDIQTSVIVISAHSDMENVVQAVKLGASDFIWEDFKTTLLI